MATIIWCDRVRHIVTEPRTTVEALITGRCPNGCGGDGNAACSACPPFIKTTAYDATGSEIETWIANPPDFVYFTPAGGSQPQRALNRRLVSSFEAMPGDAV